MWLLFIMFLQVPSHNTMLATFETSQACERERDRIEEEMAKAYPGDDGYQLQCRFQAGRSRPIPASNKERP